MVGSKSAPSGLGTLSGGERVVIVGDNSRNVSLLSDALAGYAVTTVSSPEQLTPVLSGALSADAVVVDTQTVTDDVTALVETVLERGLPVVLLASESSPRVRHAAAGTEGLRFREKPLRSTDLRAIVGETLE